MIFDLTIVLITGLLKGIPWINSRHKERKQAFEKKYHKGIDFSSIRFKSINCIEITQFYFTDQIAGWVIRSGKIKITFRYTKLFVPSGMLSGLMISDGEMKRALKPSFSSGTSKSNRVNRLEHLYLSLTQKSVRLLKHMPDTLQLTNFKVFRNGSTEESLHIHNFSVLHHLYTMEAVVNSKKETRQVSLNGVLEKEKNTAGLFRITSAISSTDSHNWQDDSIQAGTDQLQLEFIVQERDRENFSYHVNIHSPGFRLGGKSFIHTQEGSRGFQATINCELGPSGLLLGNNTHVWLNHLHFDVIGEHMFKDQKCIKLELTCNACSADDLLRSFRWFQFRDIYTSTYSGLFGFTSRLEWRLPLLKLDFNLAVSHDLRMTNAGMLDLHYLKQPFSHTIYENGTPVRQILLDQSNPGFVPLPLISKHLKNAILLSEDCRFYEHNGIDLQKIRNAVIENLAAKKIRSGASTITMQLIKNLFLHPARRIDRKIEEVFLTWLTDEVFEIGKDRLLEIYLNIIEMGPGIYGISEAAAFYFCKKADELTLTESLVISYIVPRPKYFVHALKSGSLILVENMLSHFVTMLESMLQRKLITREEADQVKYEIEFSNGLGRLKLKDKTGYLHPVLLTAYQKTLELWIERYQELPRPLISCTYRSPALLQELHRQDQATTCNMPGNADHGQSPHNHQPSMAFDIIFKNNAGSLDWSESLFDTFAGMMDELDDNKEVVWGGNSQLAKDKRHFELKNWHLKVL
jgi:hypothetical protein